MKPKCEICHKEEATGTIWLTPEQSPVHVAGLYRIGDKCSGKKGKS